MGPVAAYRQNVLRQSVEIMAALGLRREGDLYFLPEDADLIKQGKLADDLWREAPRHGPAAPPPRPVPAPATAGVRPPARRRPPPPRTPAGTARLAARRAELVRRVREPAPPVRRPPGSPRRPARRCRGPRLPGGDQPGRHQGASGPKIGVKPGWNVFLRQLEAMDRAIRSEVIPLTRDGSAAEGGRAGSTAGPPRWRLTRRRPGSRSPIAWPPSWASGPPRRPDGRPGR